MFSPHCEFINPRPQPPALVRPSPPTLIPAEITTPAPAATPSLRPPSTGLLEPASPHVQPATPRMMARRGLTQRSEMTSNLDRGAKLCIQCRINRCVQSRDRDRAQTACADVALVLGSPVSMALCQHPEPLAQKRRRLRLVALSVFRIFVILGIPTQWRPPWVTHGSTRPLENVDSASRNAQMLGPSRFAPPHRLFFASAGLTYALFACGPIT